MEIDGFLEARIWRIKKFECESFKNASVEYCFTSFNQTVLITLVVSHVYFITQSMSKGCDHQRQPAQTF